MHILMKHFALFLYNRWKCGFRTGGWSGREWREDSRLRPTTRKMTTLTQRPRPALNEQRGMALWKRRWHGERLGVNWTPTQHNATVTNFYGKLQESIKTLFNSQERNHRASSFAVVNSWFMSIMNCIFDTLLMNTLFKRPPLVVFKILEMILMVIVDQWQSPDRSFKASDDISDCDVIVFESIPFGSSIVIMAFDAWLQPPGKTQTAQVLPSHKCLQNQMIFFHFVSFFFLEYSFFFNLSSIFFLLFFFYTCWMLLIKHRCCLFLQIE